MLSKPKTVFGVVLILLLLLIYTVYKAAIEVATSQYSQEFAEWVKLSQDTTADISYWEESLEILEFLNRVSLNDAQVSSLLGQHYEWGAALIAVDEDAKLRMLSKALDAYRYASIINSTDGYNWVNLCGAKLKARQIDTEFNNCIAVASTLYRWDLSVQYKVTETGLASWRSLFPETRKHVLGSASRAIIMDPQLLFELAEKYNKVEHFCLISSDDIRAKVGVCL